VARRVGTALAPLLYDLGRADALGKGRPAEGDLQSIDELERRVNEALAEGAALSVRDLAIRGGDLMSELGLRQGPAIGRVLHRLLEIVTEEPTKNEVGWQVPLGHKINALTCDCGSFSD
jgi:tRNA nucleotidyltransferase (CCA-adding enzyme)